MSSPSRRPMLLGLIGSGISASLTPAMHEREGDEQGLRTQYKIINLTTLGLGAEALPDLLLAAERMGFNGLNITHPCKQAVLPLLDHIDQLASKVGACNTIVRAKNGELHGYNTDVDSVTTPLARRIDLNGARILVRGAGGAARAAVFGLRKAGAEVWIANRTPEKAAALAAEAGAHLAGSGEAGSSAAGMIFDAMVNATPLGMQSSAAGSSMHEKPSTDATPPGCEPLPAKLVFDMVYRPLETPLITQARAQGLPVITGEEMFVHQGARQFELWTGEPAPEDEMRQAVLHALEEARLSPPPIELPA